MTGLEEIPDRKYQVWNTGIFRKREILLILDNDNIYLYKFIFNYNTVIDRHMHIEQLTEHTHIPDTTIPHKIYFRWGIKRHLEWVLSKLMGFF